MNMRRKAVVAMSGGVDSSVAAALIKEEGFDVVGIMMKLWRGAAANNESGCCSLDAAEDARRVAQVLDIPFYVFNFADRFEEKVVRPFIDEYALGRTPNPCIECNRSIKFSLLQERAKVFGADFVVTGHYARIESNHRFHLLKGRDETKDQSYVLYMLDQTELAHAKFPVGEYTKPEIREIAASLGLRTAHKPESQEICFVPSGDTQSYIDDVIPSGSVPGPIIDSSGKVLGNHRGFAHYTVGQRRGLGISRGLRLYVKSVESSSNTLVVATSEEMYCDALEMERVSFTAGVGQPQFRASIMMRYRGPQAMASVVTEGSRWKVHFDEVQPIPAPGQAAVFYSGDEVLGGGTISRTL